MLCGLCLTHIYCFVHLWVLSLSLPPSSLLLSLSLSLFLLVVFLLSLSDLHLVSQGHEKARYIWVYCLEICSANNPLKIWFYLPQFREEWEITWERKRAQVIVSVVLGKVRRAVVQLLLSLKFFHSLGVYPCSFRLCVVLLFYKVALPVQVRNQFNFCQISNRLNTVQ